MQVSGIAYLVAWLAIVVRVTLFAEIGVPLIFVFLLYAIPFAQVATFIVYQTSRKKLIIGGTMMSHMALIVSAGLITANGPMIMYFFIVSAFGAVLYFFFDELKAIVHSPQPYRPY